MNKFFLFAFSVFLLLQKFSFSQQAFTVHVVPSAISAAPALHSGAFAMRSGQWIFLGGRLDGMHIMQSGQAFPAHLRNDSIFIVNPATNSYLSVSATQLPGFLFEAICSTNMQYFQDGKYLYMIGGYGREDSTLTWITFPSLISVDLDCLLNNVNSGNPVGSCFRQLRDSNLAVTGGGLEKIDSTYYLVFGHRFDGRYSNIASQFTQRYTHEIRKFNITDDGVNLAINNFSAQKDTDIFHRRDFNLVPQIFLNHSRGITAFGGVFQKNNDQPFLTPIDISNGLVVHQSGFNENLNQYTTATLPIYDSLNNFMHTIFFGGLSLYTLDTISMNLIQDTLVPFVSTISKVTRDSAGNLSESKMQENMPALLGANAFFIPDTTVSYLGGRIVDLNSLTGNARVGFIAGGILSDAPNVAAIDPVGMSRPNAQLYEVYIDKTVNSIPELPVNNLVNNLIVYPNPVNEILNINFTVSKESQCEIKIYNLKGELIKILLKEKKLKGEQKFNFLLSELKKGIYICIVRVGKSEKQVKVIIEN